MEDDVYVPRSRAGCLLLLIPTFMLLAMVAAYVVIFIAGIIGTTAKGDRVQVVYAACPAAEGLIRDRVGLMGLGEPEFVDSADGFALTATMPADPKIAAGIPAALARPGRLEIRAVDAPLTDPPLIEGERVEASTVHMGTEGAMTLFRLDETGADTLRVHMQQHPEGSIAYWLDGEKVGDRLNMPAEPHGNLEIYGTGPDEMAQMRIAAERSVILDAGPLPCPVAVVSTTVVEAAPKP